MSDPRQHVYELINRLPPAQLAAVTGLLETTLDPVSLATANAPLEDEPISEEEERAVAEANEWLKHNKPIPFEEVLSEFGVTLGRQTPSRHAGISPSRRRLTHSFR